MASLQVVRVSAHTSSTDDPAQPNSFACEIEALTRDGRVELARALSDSLQQAVIDAVSYFCVQQLSLLRCSRVEQDGGLLQFRVAIEGSDGKSGVGRFVSHDAAIGLTIATLRAASHAGLLKAAYRANNQQQLRIESKALVAELAEILEWDTSDPIRQLEAQAAVLEHLNRVASAAVVTAVNYPKPESILSLFDTSAWLFDAHGRRRDSYTETNLWLAWYPGVDNDDECLGRVVDSLPAAPSIKIPWIVRLFENPESWIRFRGAVALEDHDIMHVLLGRGLQDQDEAFVLGFAMGTAKRVSMLQYWVFKWVLARLYPEPYRIPSFLQPAFDLGVECGRETGNRDLYRQPLRELRELSLGEARRSAGIDMRVVRKYYELEQQRIPFTIASLRLP